MSKKLDEIIDNNLKSKQKDKIEMVTGIFKNLEIEGSPIKFSFSQGKRFKGKPAEVYELKDGEKYTIPLDVARHLNRCSYFASVHEVDEKGNYLRTKKELVDRYMFRRIDDLYDNNL